MFNHAVSTNSNLFLLEYGVQKDVTRILRLQVTGRIFFGLTRINIYQIGRDPSIGLRSFSCLRLTESIGMSTIITYCDFLLGILPDRSCIIRPYQRTFFNFPLAMKAISLLEGAGTPYSYLY